jgi:hypothetical protein
VPICAVVSILPGTDGEHIAKRADPDGCRVVPNRAGGALGNPSRSQRLRVWHVLLLAGYAR